MIYEIAGLRVQLENNFSYTDRFCKDYLSENQTSPVDIVARVTKEEFAEEKEQSLNFSDGYVENICLYRSLCLQLPTLQRMLLHCSVLEHDGSGYAFLGRSGTGKSTHTKLWLTYLDKTRVVNGDKPILQATEKGFIAYGTPWQGKEGWGCNAQIPLKGLCFLEQAKENSIVQLRPSEASLLLFKQVLMPTEETQAEATLELLDRLLTTVPAYLLRCDISERAVKTSFEQLTGCSYETSKKK